MKKKILSLLLVFMFGGTAYSQTNETGITEIKKTVSEIKSNLYNYQKIHKTLDSINDKYIYLKGKDVQLITIKTTDAGIEKNVAWYYSQGQLIYTEQFWVDLHSKTVFDNETCYLQQGHLIAWVNNENEFMDTHSADFKSLDMKLGSFGQKWKEESLK